MWWYADYLILLPNFFNQISNVQPLNVLVNKQNRWDLQNTDDPKEKVWAIAKEWYKGWRSTFSSTWWPTVDEGSVADSPASNASEAATVQVQKNSILIAPMIKLEYVLISFLIYPYADCP